jgi:hypothetical protein
MKVSEELSREHKARKAWNEQTIARLGLVCIKTNNQTKAIQIWQGDFRLYFDSSANSESWIIVNMHLNLERFLVMYLDHVKRFEGAREIKRMKE